MNSEVKLNQLFATLQSEQATTDISDVTSWIQAAAAGNAVLKTNVSAWLNVRTILITAVSVVLIGGMFVLTYNDEPLPVYEPQKGIAPVILDTTSGSENQMSKPPSRLLIQETILTLPSADSLSEVPLPIALEGQPASEPSLPIPSFDFSYAQQPKSEFGLWKSYDDHLHVDTTFSGITAIVLVGDKCDIAVHGNSGKDVTIQYNYDIDAKGLFSRNKDGQCKLSYEINNSVLTLQVKRSNQSYSGISTLSGTSTIDMHIPEGIDVRMESALGDIVTDGLQGKNIKLNTSLGDITVSNCSGILDVNIALGDISLNDVRGEITGNTSMGDIKGEGVMATAACSLTTSQGDIDVQLNNSLDDCQLDLSTSLGSVKVDRPDLKEKSRSQLKIGTGKLKVIMNTSLGKIKVR